MYQCDLNEVRPQVLWQRVLIAVFDEFLLSSKLMHGVHRNVLRLVLFRSAFVSDMCTLQRCPCVIPSLAALANACTSSRPELGTVLLTIRPIAKYKAL